MSKKFRSAFLMHPLDTSYVKRSGKKGTSFFGKLFPRPVIEFFLRFLNPFIQSRFKIAGHEAMIIICPLTSRQLMTLPKKFVLKRLKQSCDLAYKNGAKIISLGAYSAIASEQGLLLKGKTKIGITNGRAYTVYSVMEQAKPFLKRGKTIAIVGADGAIGSAVSKLTRKYAGMFKIINVGRNNIEEIYKADIIISATSSVGKVINPNKLKKDSVVIDAAKPSDISRKIKRKDITIIDGGVIQIPGSADFGINFDLPKNQLYACMAEAFILGMEKKRGDFCVGKDVSLDMVKEIGGLGKKHGFKIL